MDLVREFRLCAIPADGVTVSAKFAPGLGGSFLAELTMAERISVTDERVEVVDPSPLGDELIDPVLRDLAGTDVEGATPSRLATGIGVQQSPRVYDAIISEGLVTLHPGAKRRLLPNRPDWLSPSAEGEEPRARARAILLGEREASPRDAALVGLLAACEMVSIHVPAESRSEAEKLAARLATGDAVPEAVRVAIRGAEVAAGGAIIAANG